MQTDSTARNRALDPRQSFIVQAPAGSGKTELLTQRFLVLLSQVNMPEEILAITFTKKSAHEMRTRVINALKTAAYTTIEPELPHAKKTWQLSKAVLARNTELEWNLLANPNRLRIQTIDSFNSSLTKNLPILSQFGASPEIIDQPEALYAEAAEELLSHLEENVAWSEAIATLLLHLDNDLSKVQMLLVNMLSKRDQWLKYINPHLNNPDLRNILESYLQSAIQDHLHYLTSIFPETIQDELTLLLQYAQKDLGDDPNDLAFWLTIADFFLTKDHDWRKTVSVKEGFPAANTSPHAKEMKERAIALIDQIRDQENIREALETLRLLPSSHYTDSQWEILCALQTILHIAVAQLRVVFQTHGKIDYTENALAALTALGSDDSPTDLALALDYRIQHILIDEFQDTSSMQYQLLEKLTLGWQAGDGRTLFVVGDPMQSIYRFREAEVGLFIRARNQGLTHVQLEPLRLSVNFRSTSTIVDWVNQHFAKVLSPSDNIASGAVSYSPSTANTSTASSAWAGIDSYSTVQLHPCYDINSYSEQAKKIVELVQQTKKHNPDGSIAILVRTRSHLQAIIPALKTAQLSYQAINIEPLNMRPTIQDLMALTRALLYPADRIAWLAILRAPWCGLSLADLLALSAKGSEELIWQVLQSPEIISTLSNDGQKRLARILPILTEKMTERRRYTLRQTVESAWILLGGPACVTQASDLEDAAAYFNLLERLDTGNDLNNIDQLEQAVNKLYSAADNEADTTLQIMTIHNAKGLEFDTVILPHLEKKPMGDSKQLLMWMEKPAQNDNIDLIMAPIHATGDKSDAIYDYVKHQMKTKSHYEDGRLLYVAATRAKQNLHLLFSLQQNKDEIKPPSQSLLEKIWPAISSTISNVSVIPDTNVVSDLVSNTSRTIRRLPANWISPIKPYQTETYFTNHQQSAGLLLPDTHAAIIGTLVHTLLQQLSNQGLAWWQKHTAEQQENYLCSQLLQRGLLKQEIPQALITINKAIANLLNDPRANWILQPHAEARSEFSVTAIIDGEAKILIMDRTFIDDTGVRWIIDYKTTMDVNEDAYKKQLWHYHQAMQHIESRPIRVGLYFPLIPAWREWSFEQPPPPTPSSIKNMEEGE